MKGLLRFPFLIKLINDRRNLTRKYWVIWFDTKSKSFKGFEVENNWIPKCVLHFVKNYKRYPEDKKKQSLCFSVKSNFSVNLIKNFQLKWVHKKIKLASNIVVINAIYRGKHKGWAIKSNLPCKTFKELSTSLFLN